MPDLKSDAGRTEFGKAISDELRAFRYGEAEELLRGVLLSHPSPVAELCLQLAQGDVQISGWTAFNERIDRLARRPDPITAAWVHLSNYTDDAEDGLRHPVIEMGYLRDGKVAFSKETPASLTAMSAHYPAPWTGSPDEDGYELTISGLERLNDWLVKFDEPDISIDPVVLAVGIAAAEWFETLRWHQAVHEAMDSQGLVCDIPLIVGSHGAGPWCNAIHYRSRPFDIDPSRTKFVQFLVGFRHDLDASAPLSAALPGDTAAARQSWFRRIMR